MTLIGHSDGDLMHIGQCIGNDLLTGLTGITGITQQVDKYLYQTLRVANDQ